MKRIIISLIAFVCVSIGMWAQGIVVGNNDAYLSQTTWFETEKVVRIKMEKPGSLAAAIAAYTANNDLKDAKVAHIYFTDNNTEGMNAADIEALSTLNVETIDLQDAFYTSSKQTFTFTNSSVKSVILPDGWDKDAVNAAGTALKASSPNLGSVYSMSPNTFNYKEDNTAKVGTSVIAYVAKGNTLRTAIYHSLDDTHPCTKLSTAGVTKDTRNLTKLKSLTLLGYPSASDFSDSGDWDANGHFVPNYEAFEFSNSPNARLDGTEVKTDRKSYVDGKDEEGAVYGCGGLVVLDLRDAIITEEHCNDLTLTWTYALGKITQQVWIPTTPLLKTIPADFLSDGGLGGIREICIPANIENIKTRAFASSSHNLVHVWTTGTNDKIIYDNGAWITDGTNDDTPENDVKHFGMSDIDAYDGENNVTYGTYTFSENIKLIESNAFATGYRVKDVYSLAVDAPECHVDAFTSVMYNGFNTYDQTAITEGIIDREAYTNSKKSRMYMTMLHYPRECQTPNVQRYTDPTREYNVATGLRDGRGNNLYFPNQSEFTIAYAQGTSGYLWNAWENKRTEWGDMEIASPQGFLDPHSTTNQTQANTNWENNPNEDKNDRSFYDVRLDAMGQPTVQKPSALQWYYNTIWEEKQLYPEMQYTNTETVVGQQQKLDENGKPKYVEGDCDFVQDYTIDKDANGNLVENITVDANGAKVRDYSYDEDPEGNYVHEIIISEASNGQKVIDFDYVETEGGDYYHPLVSRNWDSNKPKPWYSQTESWVECPETEATHVLPQGWSNAGWRITYAEWAALTYDTPGHVFVKSVTKWTEDNNNGSHYISEGWANYTEGASDFAENINDTRFNRVQKTPITYRDYVEATDFGETRYNISDNGIRAYAGAADDEAGYDRYTKNYANTLRDYDASTDANETRYTVGTGYRAYVENGDPDSWLQRYTKNYIAGSYRAFDNTKDASDETRYCPDMEDVYAIVKGKQNDYRGWHQFVLAAYAHNLKVPMEPIRSFITDNDWWTICVPYDLKYDDMIMFFGTEAAKNGGKAKIPYLSKLMYVVRDQKNEQITLMFSKNLMEYKETMSATDHVHGTIKDTDASGKYSDVEIAQNPVILHAGVPYLIRPNMTKEGDAYVRQFDIFADQKADLYNRLYTAAYLGGNEQMAQIYDGEYTVPAYVVGEGSESTVESKKISNQDGSEFTYQSGTIKYKGKDTEYKVSDDFTYTFVGSYYKSVMPKHCYFLGWDSEHNCASFWYSRVEEKDAWNWNNETAIICPNFNTSKKIDPATSLKDPARWILSSSDLANDDFPSGSASGAKAFTMDFGATNYNDSEATGIEEIVPATTESETISVYNLNGVFMGNSVEGLPKGIYIANGKKFVVK